MGMDVRTDSKRIRSKIGYLPENVPLYSWMRVQQYLEFVTVAKGIPSANRVAVIEKVAGSVGISEVMGRIIGTLSKGFRQRVGLGQALMGDPPLLVLDEPSIGLDPKQIREIRELIRSFARNRTVILSSHILPEVSQVCDRVIIINKGSIVAEDTPENLARRHRKSTQCRIAVRAGEEEAASFLTNINGVTSVETEKTGEDRQATFLVEAEPDTDIRPTLSRAVVEKGWDLLELTPLDVSLEDVFIELVTEENEAANSESDSRRKEVA
jgi:ABC-2 type transport system ATP-binding protein